MHAGGQMVSFQKAFDISGNVWGDVTQLVRG